MDTISAKFTSPCHNSMIVNDFSCSDPASRPNLIPNQTKPYEYLPVAISNRINPIRTLPPIPGRTLYGGFRTWPNLLSFWGTYRFSCICRWLSRRRPSPMQRLLPFGRRMPTAIYVKSHWQVSPIADIGSEAYSKASFGLARLLRRAIALTLSVIASIARPRASVRLWLSSQPRPYQKIRVSRRRRSGA